MQGAEAAAKHDAATSAAHSAAADHGSLWCLAAPFSNCRIALNFRVSKFSRIAIFEEVLVKCRRNVANKLFISRYFNPVLRSARTSLCTCNKLIALTAKLFLSVEVQNLHT